MNDIIKYPRTPHLKGSRLQKGDEDLSQIPFDIIKDKYIVIEEKVDGANTGISFNNGMLLLQSRGHFLTGGSRERHYNLFKQWANNYKNELYDVLGERYIMYGEWLYAKHSIYYDNLTSYFLEFDIYDKLNKVFLSTKKRKELLKNLNIKSVPVLATGNFKKIEDILVFLKESNYISKNHRENLKKEALKYNQDIERVFKETENTMLMEGLYIKVEEDGKVVDRMKYVRYSFLQTVEESKTHWLDRTIIPNKLGDFDE